MVIWFGSGEQNQLGDYLVRAFGIYGLQDFTDTIVFPVKKFRGPMSMTDSKQSLDIDFLDNMYVFATVVPG